MDKEVSFIYMKAEDHLVPHSMRLIQAEALLAFP